MNPTKSKSSLVSSVTLLLLLTVSQHQHVATALINGFNLPALGFSTWNHFGPSINDALLREVADAMVSSGLRDAGYQFLNLDDGWAQGRYANGSIYPDPALFPFGMKNISSYVLSKGLKMGIYTARGSQTCCGKPGSNGYEYQDAQSYADWGIGYLKEDSCGGTTNGTVWEQYARMRDALNSTNASIYFSITEAVPWTDGHEAMHCYGDSVFTVIPWVASGLDPTTLANSFLVEYCNNEDFFGCTDAYQCGPGGFLSNLDSQQLLTLDNLTVPGAFNDNDMLEVCNGGQSQAEYRSQFSTWSILASPLILGNDPRNMDADCLAIVLNTDVIAVNQDPLVIRGKLVYQWPDSVWPNISVAKTAIEAMTAAKKGKNGAFLRKQQNNNNHHHHTGENNEEVSESASQYRNRKSRDWISPAERKKRLESAAPAAPIELYALSMELCNASAPEQLFVYNATGTGLLVGTSTNLCVTYGGYKEANTYMGACENWTSPGIGSQLWTPSTSSSPSPGYTIFNNNDNPGKVLDVYNCNVSDPHAVQVCTEAGADCYGPSGVPVGTGGCTATNNLNQMFTFTNNDNGALIMSALNNSTYCLATKALPPPPVDIRLQVWAKPMVDNSVAAVAFNRSPLPLQANLTWEMIGLTVPNGRTANVTDLWTKESTLYTGVNGLNVTVQPHDVFMMRVWVL